LLSWIVEQSLRHRVAVLLATLALAAVGVVSLTRIDIDAFPDTTPVMVQINTVAPALGPEEVEQRITFPIEQALGGLPRIEQLRSISKFGLSQVVITFEDGTDIYFARQVVNERLTTVELPAGTDRPKMGPVATGLGEIFHYVVTSDGHDLTDLRTIHDWVIRPKMRTVKGTAEINSWGGLEKQFQVRVDPDRLVKHQVSFDQVAAAVEQNNRNVGGGMIRENSQALLVQGVGRTRNLAEIRDIVVTARAGTPIKVGDVADVEVGSEIRRGAVTADGKGEVVLGLGFMLMGENSHQVTWAMKERLDQVKAALPRDAHGNPTVKVEAVYDRTELVNFVIATVRANLFEGGLLVVAVLFLFLGNLRAAGIVALAIPLSMLFAFAGMLRFGIAASLLSLGAIDFGMVVDSSVVMVENCVRHLAAPGDRRTRLEVIRDAAVEVRKPTLFGELIIMIVYLPILTLEGVEGKLFRPMALTVLFALAGSMLLSMTLMPVLASLLLPRRISHEEPFLMRVAHRIHDPILRLCMEYKWTVIIFTLIVLTVAFGVMAPNLGTEFVPRLSEGAICVNAIRLAGTDLDQSIRENTRIEQALLRAFPEVAHVWSRIGTAEVATDPMGIELTDIFITLKPRERWAQARADRLASLRRSEDTSPDLLKSLESRAATSQAELTTLIEEELRSFPGQKFAFSQPIELRMNEMATGVRSDVALKIYGDNLEQLRKSAEEVKQVLVREVPGAADVNVEQVTGQPVLQVRIKQNEIARYGIPARAVLDLVESVGSKPLGDVIDGQYRFPLVVRLPEKHRRNIEAIGAMLVKSPAGELVPVSRLATLEVIEGPSTITREWGQRRITVTANVRGRDLGSFVADAQAKVRAAVTLPSDGRYHMEWSGQFEHYERACNRLLLVGAVAGLLILGLLYLTYGNFVDAARVLTGAWLGWVGGIAALWLRGMPFSISAAVGFIAMSGVAVLDDMILVSYIRQLRRKGVPRDAAVRQAAITRLRPVLMTTLVASLGFLPMAVSTGMGAEVQRPLATVVIGGVVSAMLMSLLVIRVLYVLFDSLAGWLRRMFAAVLNVPPASLNWIFGDTEPEAEDVIPVERPLESASERVRVP
jgi:cobalt-zinc-cadmium resistance protein CzcA